MTGVSGTRLAIAALIALGCSAPAKRLAPAQRQMAPSAPRTPIPEQTGYCTRLQPLLDQAVKSAQIGTEMTCLDIPGVTELGRYGSSGAAEEDTLVNCFDDASDYQGLLDQPPATFALAIEQAFVREAEESGSLGLGALIPWLPQVTVSGGRGARAAATVRITDAHFVTLVGVATKLQGEPRETECLRALCSPDYRYVHKVLVGTPSVVVNVDRQTTNKVLLDAGVLGVNFEKRDLSEGGLEVSSKQPVTLAVARSSFRTAQTDRLCSFCGKQGQACCHEAPGCDGGLGCVKEHCVEVGGPGQPCNDKHCSDGATCVAGTCQVECGGRGQPCCGQRQCSGQLRCSANPKNSTETLVLSQRTLVEGGFFGTSEDRTLGLSNCSGLKRRARFAVTELGNGRGDCAKAWWFDPQNTRDCRVGVHFNVSVFGDIECQLDVYATPPPEPDVCSP